MVIVDVIEDSPAYKVGIFSGDKIICVNESKLKGMSSDEVISKMKGKRGSKVKLKILRDKKTLDFEVTRDVILDQSSYCYHFKDQNIYYLALKVFSENSPAQMKNILEKINKDSKCKGLILDMRNNPGGVIEAGIDIPGLFLPKDSVIVTTRDNQNNIVKSYSTRKDPILEKDLCIFILINNFTASASEILAGAMRYHSKRACEKKDSKGASPMIFLAGTTTFGKGSVQEVIPISSGCAVKVTSMLYFLPDGSSVQAKGVSPDFLLHPKSPISREAKWIRELFGQEKSMKHHITAGEVSSIVSKKELELAKDIDKREAKKTQKLDEIKAKEDQSDKELNDDFLYQDVGYLRDSLESLNKKEEKKEKSLQDLEKKKAEILSRDYQIQSCVNMITFLDFAKKCEPEEVSNREKAFSFLKKNFVTDNGLNIEKVK